MIMMWICKVRNHNCSRHSHIITPAGLCHSKSFCTISQSLLWIIQLDTRSLMLFQSSLMIVNEKIFHKHGYHRSRSIGKWLGMETRLEWDTRAFFVITYGSSKTHMCNCKPLKPIIYHMQNKIETNMTN